MYFTTRAEDVHVYGCIVHHGGFTSVIKSPTFPYLFPISLSLFLTVFCTVVSLSVPSRRNCRRGSIQNHTSQQCYKDLLKGSILQRVGAEEQARLIQVNRVIVIHSFLHISCEKFPCVHIYIMYFVNSTCTCSVIITLHICVSTILVYMYMYLHVHVLVPCMVLYIYMYMYMCISTCMSVDKFFFLSFFPYNAWYAIHTCTCTNHSMRW